MPGMIDTNSHAADALSYSEAMRRDKIMQAMGSGNNLTGLGGLMVGPGTSNPLNQVARMAGSTNDGRKVVFDAQVRVTHVSNGYVVEVTNHNSVQFESRVEVMIAKDIKEVNELLAASMVSFRLEDR